MATSSTEPSPEPLFDLHDLHGQAALHVAARMGQAQVVKVLLEAGANADQADVDGWTPLRAAAWGGHTEVRNNNFEFFSKVTPNFLGGRIISKPWMFA